MTPPRRFELVLLDTIHTTLGRTTLGFGKYPWGASDVIRAMLPFVNPDDPAKQAIDAAWEDLQRRLT